MSYPSIPIDNISSADDPLYPFYKGFGELAGSLLDLEPADIQFAADYFGYDMESSDTNKDLISMALAGDSLAIQELTKRFINHSGKENILQFVDLFKTPQEVVLKAFFPKAKDLIVKDCSLVEREVSQFLLRLKGDSGAGLATPWGEIYVDFHDVNTVINRWLRMTGSRIRVFIRWDGKEVMGRISDESSQMVKGDSVDILVFDKIIIDNNRKVEKISASSDTIATVAIFKNRLEDWLKRWVSNSSRDYTDQGWILQVRNLVTSYYSKERLMSDGMNIYRRHEIAHFELDKDVGEIPFAMLRASWGKSEGDQDQHLLQEVSANLTTLKTIMAQAKTAGEKADALAIWTFWSAANPKESSYLPGNFNHSFARRYLVWNGTAFEIKDPGALNREIRNLKAEVENALKGLGERMIKHFGEKRFEKMLSKTKLKLTKADPRFVTTDSKLLKRLALISIFDLYQIRYGTGGAFKKFKRRHFR